MFSAIMEGVDNPGAHAQGLSPEEKSTVDLKWVVGHQGNDVVYTGYASVNGGQLQPIAKLVNPKAGGHTRAAGQVVDPRNPLITSSQSTNIGRLRIDGAGQENKMAATLSPSVQPGGYYNDGYNYGYGYY